MPDLKGFQGRPTTDFGREGLFNLLSSRVDLDGAQVLDLFAGTGMVSLEFLSRGAASVTSVEKAPRRAGCCRASLQQQRQFACGVCGCVGVLEQALDAVRRGLDPVRPSRLETLPDVVRENGLVADGGWFILEHGERVDVSDRPGHVLSRKYGHVHFSLTTFD